MGLGRSAGARESAKEVMGVSAPPPAISTPTSVAIDAYGPPTPTTPVSTPAAIIGTPQVQSALPSGLSVSTPGISQNNVTLGPQIDASYSVYQPGALGSLQDYFAKQKGANLIDGRLYIKPEDYAAAEANLKPLTEQQLSQYRPMIGNLSAVGQRDGQTFYNVADFNKRLDPYYSIDLNPWAGRAETANIKPVTTIDGQTYYRKADLAPLSSMKTYYQNVDPLVQKLMGKAYGTDEKGGYVTGLVNLGAFQVGVGDFGTAEIGSGKYNILDKSGNVLGVGYDPVREAANELFSQNELNRALTKVKPSIGGTYTYGGVTYPTLQDAQAAVKSKFDFNVQKDEWRGGQGFGGKLADWEVLGQALRGSLSPSGLNQWGSLPLNSKSETISGANTLYGSTPVFYNGKLIGYQADLAAAPDWKGSSGGGQDKSSWNPFGYQSSHNGKSHAWATGLNRQIDPSQYAGLVQGLDKTQYFVPTANVEKLPGWTNKEGYTHQDRNYGAMASAGDLGKIATVVGDVVGMATTGIPWGSIGAGGISALEGDSKALENYAKNAALQYAGAQLGALGGGKDLFGTGFSAGSPAINTAIQKGLVTSGLGAVAGQDANKALTSGLLSGLSSYGGSLIGGDMNPTIGQQAAKVGLNTGMSGLQAAATGKDVGEGLATGAAGGLMNLGLSEAANALGIKTQQGMMAFANPVLRQIIMQRMMANRKA